MGQAAIFNGAFIKLLKDQLKFGETAAILTGTDDPRVVAKDAPRGSVYLRTSDGTFFIKQDAGSSINWDLYVSNDEFDLSFTAHPNLTIRNGFILLDDGRELTTFDGISTYNADIIVNLTTILGGSPAASTTYYLYIDLTTLSSAVVLTGGRSVYGVAQANLTLSTTAPALRNARRYLPLGIVNTTAGSLWSTPVYTLAKRRHDSRITEPSSVIFTQDKTQVRSVGDTGQIRLGHLTDANSFALSSLSAVGSFFNLATNSNDGSVNAKHLTNPGAGVTFVGTGIFGNDFASTYAGTNKILTSSDAFYNPGNNKSISAGAWVSMTNWSPGSGVPFEIFRVGTALGGDRGFTLQVNINGDIVATGTNAPAATNWTVTVLNPGFTANSWHHIVWRYNFAATRLSIFIDGEEAGFTAAMTNQRAVTVPALTIGSTGALTQTVKMRELFFVVNGLVTQNDIRKLQSYRIDHSTGALPANQVWSANYYRADSKITNQIDQSSWVVDKTSSTSVYVDFSDIDSTEFVSFKLQETDFNAFLVPKTPPFDTGYVSSLAGINVNHPDASNFVANHALAATPTYYTLQYEATTGQFDGLEVANYLSVTSSQLIGDLSSLTIGPSNRVRIFANTGIDPTAAVGTATATSSGVLSATTQTIGGYKTFTNGIRTPVIAATSAYPAVAGDDIFADSSGAGFIITLPASPTIGAKVIIRDATGTFAVNPVTVDRNGSNIQGAASNLTLNINAQKVELVFYSVPAGWRVF